MNTYLETGIAVVLIFLLFCIVVYIIQEGIAQALKFRNDMLKMAIDKVLTDGHLTTLANDFFQHPQINLLKKKATRMPAYIPSANFAMTIMDLVANKAGNRTGDLYADFKTGLANLPNSAAGIGPLLRTWLENSKTVEDLKATIEKWFNEYMDRVTGWYKDKSSRITRLIAFAVAIAFNLDMVSITKTIYSNDILRATLVKTAENMVDNPDVVESYMKDEISSKMNVLDSNFKKDSAGRTQAEKDSLKSHYDKQRVATLKGYYQANIQLAKALVDSAGGNDVVGWNKWPKEIIKERVAKSKNENSVEWILMLLGIALGGAGLSMGAPFWFDLLGKLVNVRRAGIKPPTESKAGT